MEPQIPLITATIATWLSTYSKVIITLAYVAEKNAEYEEMIEADLTRRAREFALHVCQERMMNGEYGNDQSKMDADIEFETELFKRINRK